MQEIKSNSKKRQLKDFRFFIIILFLIFVMFLLLMIRQGFIVSGGYYNALKEIEINKMAVNIVQRQEQIYRQLDFNNIRNLAKKAGLYVPQEGQIVNVDIHKRDYVNVVGEKEISHDELEAQLDEAMRNVGEYYERKEELLR